MSWTQCRAAEGRFEMCGIACLQATRAYLHKEEAVEAALREAGWKVAKREMTSTRFYYSRLLQAARASSS